MASILIDILHPAHVHFFRNVRQELIGRGYDVIVTVRDKEMAVPLLQAYDIPHTVISTQKQGAGLVVEMIARSARLWSLCRKQRPSLMLGIMGPSIAVVGRLAGIPAWVFYDTENAWITNWFAYPLASRVYSPQCYAAKKRSNQILYPGYHELAYLHPARFTPDESVARDHDIDTSKPYFIVRFVGWQASHDIGEQGLSLNEKTSIVQALEKHGRVYLSSESALPGELASRQLSIPPREIHHVMAFAGMVVGESATMASEAAVLGVPAVFISDTGRGYTDEQEREYGLVRNYTTAQLSDALAGIESDLGDIMALKERARTAREKLLTERIDVAEYIVKEIQRHHSTTPSPHHSTPKPCVE